jgi:hypothetical protein
MERDGEIRGFELDHCIGVCFWGFKANLQW